MPTGKLHGSLGSIPGLSPALPEGFQSKVVAPRNPKLTREEEMFVMLTPSAFLKEMSLTTEQKLACTREMHPPRIIQLLDMSETTHQKFSMVDLDQSLFQPFPSEIVFQNYTPCETYEVPLVLRNNDRVPRLVKVTQESSPYFKIVSPNDVCNKVAPGMPSTFHVLFTPEENKDYFHELTCITEREKFVVPIRAIGARAILDFPDQLNFSNCPVKYNSQKTLLIRNIGNREARFQLDVLSPFSVEPSIGTLGIGESMQVTVAFQPQQIGDHSEDLIIHYDTGEDIHMSVYGAATDINVRLDKNSLMIEKTFLSMANQRTVTISNRSEIIAHFQWKSWASQEEEEQQKLRFCSGLQTEEEEETNRFLAECGADHMMRERLSILSRTFHNRRKMVQGDAMLFSDNIFIIEPVEGDVWPNSSVDVNVLFKPQEAKVYQRTIYCDITGRETRLPLRIKGEGIGPKLIFNFDQLDIGKIFVGSQHSYEVILANQGSIDAIFTHVPPTTALGSSFTFDPTEGIILPGGHQAIQVSFSSSILGAFSEEFMFDVDGSPDPARFTIRGCVIGPTFHFSMPALCFGDVSFGFPYALTVCLHNTSLVPMTFNLRVPGDGTGKPSVISCDQILEKDGSAWRKESWGWVKPTEFSITPNSGTIRSQGLLDIQVTLCSNRVKKYELAMVVDVDGIGEEVLALPITARCLVPPLRLENPVLKFGRCFLQYPYQQTVKLVNEGSLPGCYGVLPQELGEQPLVLYSSLTPRGIIDPHSTVEIPLVVEAQVTGELRTTAYIAVFGRKEPSLEVCLMCTGEGPVVHVSPDEMDFGGIPVLTDVSRTLRLSNQSFIPARFLAQMVRSRSQWRVEPSKGVVPPETEVALTLVANLDDTLKFQDKVRLAVENSNVYTIPIQATGTGTTITTDRPFAPKLDLGPHFSAGPCRYHFTMMNRGRRTHQLYWMTEGFAQFRKRGQPPAAGNVKNKISSQNLEPPQPIFKLHPFRMELNPGQTVDVVLEGSSDSPKLVEERLICHAIIGKQSGKERIMSVDVTCEFIAPLLHLSAKQLSFCVEKLPGEDLTPKYEPLIVKNISSLPLSIFLSLKEPFSIYSMENQVMPADIQPTTLEIGEERELFIMFDPAYIDNLKSRVAEEFLTIQYTEHPHKDYVALRGEVHFPNLHFQTTDIDFGCILNDTEVVRHIQMTNYSPLPVRFRWSFLMEDWESYIRFPPGVHKTRFESRTATELGNNEELQATVVTDVLREIAEMKSPEEKFKPQKEDWPALGEGSRVSGSQDLKKELPCGTDIFSPSPELEEMPWIMEPLPPEEEHLIAGVEEVFDILPLYGMLQPSESQQLSFTFFGHSGISARVKALCEVEGGPTYEITLRGEASLVSYELDIKEIDYGLQPFDQVAEAECVLRNIGKVSFQFEVLNNIEATVENPPPGVPLVLPSSGYIASGAEQLLKVYYFPGIPEVFRRTFQVQVAHLEPENITLEGEGIFSRICLDLPRDIKGKEKYHCLLKVAKEKLEKELHSDESSSRPRTMTSDHLLDESISSHDTLLQMELERLLVKEHALEHLELITSCPLEDTQRARRKLIKALLPQYVLDFGYVILGSIRTHIIKITNTCHFPVSFYADRKTLTDTGFSTELDRVKNLPYCETETFEVRFDPRGANLSLGDVEILLPIQVVRGPVFHVRLHATVTMPTLSISCEKLEFNDVQCGQCQVKTVQLHNQLPVLCEWAASSQEQTKQVDKHMPMHLRRKLRQDLKPPPQVFEMLPAYGMLVSGQKINVQVKFMPLEEKFYSQRLVLTISKSSQRVPLLVQGKGLEPRLDFIPTVLGLGPILPYSPGDDADVVVKNPCSFPIEFYSLELDKQYLEEEMILRMVKGYDSQNTLLLPPRQPGEKLPTELLEYSEEQKRIQEEQAKAEQSDNLSHETGQKSEEEEDLTSHVEKLEPSSTLHGPSTSNCDEGNSPRLEPKPNEGEDEIDKGLAAGEKPQTIDGDVVKAVGELDNNPVSRAIARHLGIDISAEAHAAKNRRGIAVIIHGAPLTGKTTAAISLAKYYSAAYLSIDSVILEAISDGSSQAGLRARELCIRAALEQAQREAEEKASQAMEAAAGQQAQAQTAAGLSIEAVAKHTAEGNQISESKTGPQSVISKGNRGSMAGRGGKSDSHPVQGQKQQTSDQSQATSNPFPVAPIQRRLSVSASVAGESGLMSCVLPEELLVDILAERMQLSDCFQGIVFDGLESLFVRNIPSALNCLLKAINNRRFIYMVNLHQEYVAMKAREKVKKEQEELQKRQKMEEEKARFEEMDEEEYDALSEEEKANLDRKRLKILRERKREQEERLARELQEKKLQEELERQREEEEMKKKARKGKRESAKEDAAGKRSHLGNKQTGSVSVLKSDARVESAVERRASVRDRPESVSNETDDPSKKRKSRDFKGFMTDPAQPGVQPAGTVGQEESEKDTLSDSEKLLIQRFKSYETAQKELTHILNFWDRAQGVLQHPATPDDNQQDGDDLIPERQTMSVRKGRKDRERERLERQEKERAEKERLEKEKVEKERMDKLKTMEGARALIPQSSSTALQGAEGACLDEPSGQMEIGVPHIDLQVFSIEDANYKKVLESGRLPSVDEILDSLGLGPSGPPAPPPTMFSVVPYPVKRKPQSGLEILQHFAFIATSPDDPNVIVEEKKEPEPEPELTVPIQMPKEEQVTPTKTRGKKEKQEQGRESQKEKRRSATLRKSQQNMDSRSPPPSAITPLSDIDQGSLLGEAIQEKLPRLNYFRWVVPPNGEVSMRIHFSSSAVGQFDQTLHFEIMGTRRRYQLYCRGVCAFPSISQDPKIVFPHRRKEAKPNEIIHKKFLMSSETFDFGPLLCGKTREKYKSGRFPENMEKINILNVSPMNAEIFFCFQHDTKAVTFILDPPTMNLKPNEKQELCLWAYPTTPGIVEDTVVCCIKENPEPAIFKVSCQGVRPELELDRKQLHFDKILLHRKDTKTIFLRNTTSMAVAWRITGLENLGDDFSVSQDQGIISPHAEYSLMVHFKASRAVNVKKFIRLEVSDVENILGIVQIENIQIFAEAYDVALDISFPKGTDGGLDFGIVKVMDEAKLGVSLKNKGKYEIAFSFSLEATGPGMSNLSSLLSILPQKGTLAPNDRPTQVQIIFHSKKEVEIIEKPILRCQVIEPNLSEGGETIASIPIKVSVRSLFTKYNIFPARDINFGAMILGARKPCTFTVENRGEIEFKYTISKLIGDAQIQQPKKGANYGAKRTRSREGSGSIKSIPFGKVKRTDSSQRETNISGQARFSLGMFTVFPGFGAIPPGGHQSITVECFPDQAGKSEELLAIDISDRDPGDHPIGIPYKLIAEACAPAFVTDDIASIFEEHRICQNMNLYQCLQHVECGGVYVEDEKRFIFNNVLVGRQATARFKITNAGKVPCDVLLTVKPVSSKSTSRINEIFEVEPPRISIPSHSHIFATVTFSPQTMQTYQCLFDAVVEGQASLLSKMRNLTFDIMGDGNLPRVSVLRPILRNKQGNPLLLFNRLLLSNSQKHPLVLKNEGSIPAQVHIDLLDERGAFSVKPRPETRCIYPVQDKQRAVMAFGKGRRAHTASLILSPGESAEFDVVFKPTMALRLDTTIHLAVVDNQYEESNVQVVGEGYQDDLTLDNIHSLVSSSSRENADEQLEEDEVEALRTDHLQFGDCHIGKQYQTTFTMTNRSQADVVRFEWPVEAALRFSPQVGHLHVGCAKDITVTLKSDVAITLSKTTAKCNLCRISFTVPADQVPDWDDRLRTVKWVDAGKSSTTQLPTKKKVIETDPEPAHTVYGGSSRELELQISATVDYAQFTCKVEKVQFKDTLLFQTRVYEFRLTNSGGVQVEFSWQVVMEGYSKVVSFAEGLLQSIAEGESQYGGETTSSQGHSSHAVSRPESVLESVSSLLSLGPDVLPFAVEPSSGIIPAGKKQDFLIKFSPLEVGEFEGRLVCSIPNLKGHQQGPVLAVKGRSILPYCHFELEYSDYISQSRRNPEQRGPHGAPPGATLDPNTRVIEFSAVGVHTKNSRTFSIMNPTNSGYSFLWTCEDSPSLKTPPAFRCLRERGHIDAEKKIEITFEFTPQQLDVTESFWTFTIPEQNISVPFLLVGKTSDPSVSLDRSHLNFRSLLIGEEAQETVYLINNEKKGFSFTVRENSCQSQGHIQTLLVRPMEGIIPAHSRIPITILFTPHKEGEANFNLMCDVKSKTQPLSLNVKADGYTMDVGVQCEESEGVTTSLSMRTPNTVNFNQVEINELATRQFHILNNGKFIFSFSCDVSAPKELQGYLKISPKTGSVEAGQRALTTLTFSPSKKCILKEASLLIQISNGPVFSCSLQGSAVVPGVNFSFTKHDFGACFIYYAGMPTNHQTLVIKNKESREVSLDCLYMNTSYLEVGFQAEVLPPGGTMEVSITFYPRAAVKYREIVPFEINGHFRQTIEIMGQGTEMKIEVADPKQKVVNFGALGVGQSLKKVVPIVNHSTAPLTFSLAITPNLPVLQDPKVLSLSPSTELTLKPRGGACKVEVTFSPKCRIPLFAEEVMLECAGMSRPLFVLRGCSQGIEVSLDVEHIPFGAVVLQSHSTRRVIMHNTGDIGARFEWDVKRFQPDCSISPTHGYITPGMEVAFDVTFHPLQLNQDIRYEGLECFIEGSKPLKLTLSGSCIGVPTTKEVVNFVCQVRGKQTQTILLSNKTNRSWSLHPVIEGEYWTGPDTIIVDAQQQNKPYDVTYRPLTMTTEGKKHQGSIFFPLPDGTGLQYLLQGNSEPPKSSGNIIREVPCKTSYMELLRVTNWMNKAQRLRVTVEVLKPERLDSTTTLKGLDYLDVPAASTRDYKLTFFSHKEGMFYTKVTFRNESTQEYIFYLVTFKATPAGTISSIEMTTSVRQSTSATVKVENPLAVPVTFTTDCKVPEINLPPQFTVPAQSEGTLMFEFQPLKASEVTGRLALQSTELGSFQYELILKATPAKPEKTLYFRTPLGSSQVLSAKFTNYTRQRAEYSCKIDNSDFHVEKVINAAPGSQGGTEVNVEVTYEPIQLGESRATLSIFSPAGGEYSIPLIGSAVPPKPQGPFVIRAGSASATTIPFKNVFLQTTTFSFNVDNPAFTVKPSESIRSKKVHYIQVSFDGNPSGSKAPLTGKLTISCPRATGFGQGIYWVIYLKGVTPEK